MENKAFSYYPKEAYENNKLDNDENKTEKNKSESSSPFNNLFSQNNNDFLNLLLSNLNKNDNNQNELLAKVLGNKGQNNENLQNIFSSFVNSKNNCQPTNENEQKENLQGFFSNLQNGGNNNNFQQLFKSIINNTQSNQNNEQDSGNSFPLNNIPSVLLNLLLNNNSNSNALLPLFQMLSGKKESNLIPNNQLSFLLQMLTQTKKQKLNDEKTIKKENKNIKYIKSRNYFKKN